MGPYGEIKETMAGYIIVKAKDFDEAVTLQKVARFTGRG